MNSPSTSNYRILFLNQVSIPLFRELVCDVAAACSPVGLYTGAAHIPPDFTHDGLTVSIAPSYNRGGILSRLWSWLRYFFGALLAAGRQPHDTVLFIVSNPPFLGLVGLLYKLVRRQRYVVLVYDIYPELLLGLGTIRHGVVAAVWAAANRLILRYATLVFTIGEDMAHSLENAYDLSKTAAGKAVIIPNWADIHRISPMDKQDNPFARRHGQVGKITVIYSGNLGNTHDIDSIIAVAQSLKDHPDIAFLIIGEGAKWALVEQAVRLGQLRNVTLLPLQPEELVPYSMATGDIGIIAYQPGTEGYIVPSKSYYYMAAGVVPLVICSRATTLSRMLEDNQCGVTVQCGHIEELKRAIMDLSENAGRLARYKESARWTAERYFSRSNTGIYIETMRRYGILH